MNSEGAKDTNCGTTVNLLSTSTAPPLITTPLRTTPNLSASTDTRSTNSKGANTTYNMPVNQLSMCAVPQNVTTINTTPNITPVSNFPNQTVDLTTNNGCINTTYSAPVKPFSGILQIGQQRLGSTLTNTTNRNTNNTQVNQIYNPRLEIYGNNEGPRNAYGTPANQFSTSTQQRLDSTLTNTTNRNPNSTQVNQFSTQLLDTPTNSEGPRNAYCTPANQFSTPTQMHHLQRLPQLPQGTYHSTTYTTTTTTTTSSSDHVVLAPISTHQARDKSAPLGSCSVSCADNFSKVTKELNEAKDKLFALSIQMAEQSSHINKLMEENRRYIKENEKLKRKSPSRNATLLTHNNFDHFGSDVGLADVVTETCVGPDDVLTHLQDRVMALQIHNDELTVCLEREKRKRRDAEARNERDEGYIKRLEDSVQALRGTRVVMDSNAYRQLAEAYIASRRPAARRSHTHSHNGSDLVCDSSNTSLTIPSIPLQTTSCPSSPKSDFTSSSSPDTTSSSSRILKDNQHMYPAAPRRSGSIRVTKDRTGERGNKALTSGGTMTPWEYQQLLENLENMDGSNRGALS